MIINPGHQRETVFSIKVEKNYVQNIREIYGKRHILQISKHRWSWRKRQRLNSNNTVVTYNNKWKCAIFSH